MKKVKWSSVNLISTIGKQMVAYVLLILLLAAGYTLFVSGLSLIIGKTINANNPFWIGVIVFFTFFLFNPLRDAIQSYLDRVFARSKIRYREALQSFSSNLTQSLKLQDIINLLREHVTDSVAPYAIHIYLYDNLTDQYGAAPGFDNHSTSDLRFTPKDPLTKYLSASDQPLYVKDFKALPKELDPSRTRLVLLGAVLFIPLPGQHKLAGWLAISPRQTKPYEKAEINYLERVADQAAIAIERAQVISDLERRVYELNVLSRFTQGINITITFADTLELIYAHTNLLIPTQDFFITLVDSYKNALYHAFYLENNERQELRENQPIPYGQGLTRNIITTRHTLVTMDYERECHNRGTLPEIQNIYSWVGVPLNSSSETIGAISLGSRMPDIIYTEEQASLLQAIADQAAGAIIKTRLLEEAERRTNQLTTLNEVARGISSTLSLRPLLREILQGAISILHCTDGLLYLLDPHTQELLLESTIGGTVYDAPGYEISIDKGWVGHVISTREALVLNDIHRTVEIPEDPVWKANTAIRDMLIVPMLLQSQVTGVLIVANRLDGMPFSIDDQGMLTAFTSQAVISLENARLYTTTDQILADRVEELSVMQRIDQELNASLDVNRAMRITLEWAMRQSKAMAGLIGMVIENGVQVIASYGYAHELETFENSTIPQAFRPIQAAFHNNNPQLYHIDEGEQQAILTKAKVQIVAAIRTPVDVLGILLLENDQIGSFSDENLDFLSRLSDHAAIAIANARLYSEVQEANQAKNDFISFISHELKTPMTSIRGFTDLLASGIVGPLNENQASFLGTIRSNVDRMTTLVSDLTDVSRIEAGRLRLEYGAVPVLEVVEDVIRSIQAQITEKQQEIDVLAPADLPAMWGDRTRLIQILTNLVSNAHKYSPTQSRIKIKAEQIEQELPQSTIRLIQIAVQDEGYGILPEHQLHIFEKFYRSDDQKVRDLPGTGLGLNISKQLVELQGGRIWFESQYRTGTSFYFTIPIAEISNP